MKKKNILIALLAIGLVGLTEVHNANAYFTTYVTAKGGYEVSFRHKEEIHEQFSDWNKYVTITNQEDSIPVYVRAKAFAGSTYKLTYSGADWTYNPSDGYYYYNKELKGGETTTVLLVSIDNIPVNAQESENFNVIVIYESLPVQYDENGNMLDATKADWTETLTSTTETITGKPETEDIEAGNTGLGNSEAGTTETGNNGAGNTGSDTTQGGNEHE